RIGHALQPAEPLSWQPVDDHLGWHEQGDGRYYLGIFVENGRIADVGDVRYGTGLRKIVEELRLEVRLTAQQNVILAGVAPADRARVDELLAQHGIAAVDRLPRALRYSMACPAIPTCGLAVAEAERALPGLVRQLAAMLDDLGLADERVSFRMSGCPHGWSR